MTQRSSERSFLNIISIDTSAFLQRRDLKDDVKIHITNPLETHSLDPHIED